MSLEYKPRTQYLYGEITKRVKYLILQYEISKRVKYQSQACSLGQTLELGFEMEPANVAIVRKQKNVKMSIDYIIEIVQTYRYLHNKAVWTQDPLQMGVELGHTPFHNSYLQNLR